MASYNLRTVLKMMGQNILNWVKSNCVNNLLSTSANLPLAAAQGKVLDEKIGQVTQSLNSKQDKLTNPLTKSDVVDNLTSTSTNTPLSAKQGNVLKGLIDKLSTLITNISNALNSHKHKVNAKNVEVPDVRVAGGSWTQISAKHGVNTNYVTSVEPYVNGAPLCNATNCWLDGEYIKWNVSNVKQADAVVNIVTVGAVIRYL